MRLGVQLFLHVDEKWKFEARQGCRDGEILRLSDELADIGRSSGDCFPRHLGIHLRESTDVHCLGLVVARIEVVDAETEVIF